jgi:hypothetical protein
MEYIHTGSSEDMRSANYWLRGISWDAVTFWMWMITSKLCGKDREA